MEKAPVESIAQLLQYCEGFAKQMLSRSGEFYPFGAFVNTQRKVEAVAGDLGAERPSPRELFSFLQGILEEMQRDGKLLAHGVAANVNIPKEYAPAFPDGIRVHVVAPGVCNRFVYTPYRLLPYRKLRQLLGFLATVEYGKPIVVELEGTSA